MSNHGIKFNTIYKKAPTYTYDIIKLHGHKYKKI